MAETPEPIDPKPPEPGKNESGDRADLIALGIGCLVFVVMFVAIVLVGMSGR